MGSNIRWIKLVLIAILLHFPSVALGKEKGPLLHSEAAILMDAKTGKVLFQKNAHQPMYPASITKIVTGIMAVESGRLGELAKTSKRARWAEGTRIYLAQDESKPLIELVYGLMMNSGNDAAVAIAEHLGGSVEQFAHMMNEFGTKTLGLKDTHFVNPHGLFHEDHYTTAFDMAVIAQYAMKNPTFREIVGTKKRPWHGLEWDSVLVNHNKLLWRYEGTIGIKNGYVAKAGNTLVTSAKRGGTELIVVCLKAQGSERVYKDTTALLDYGFSHFETKRIFSKGKKVSDSKGVEYEVIQDFFVTVPKGENPTFQVKDHGEVTVQTGEEENTYPGMLRAVPQKKISLSKESEVKDTDKPVRTFELTATIVAIILVLIAWIFFNHRVKPTRGAKSHRDSGTV